MKDPHVQVAMLTNEVVDLREENRRLRDAIEYTLEHIDCHSWRCVARMEAALALPNVPAGLANERVVVEDGSASKLAVEPSEGHMGPYPLREQ